LDDYRGLYAACDIKKAMLAGIVEDSRGVQFCSTAASCEDLPGEWACLLEKTRDTGLLYWMLERGERSMIFGSGGILHNPILKEIGENYGSRVRSFYLKTAKLDRPVRVEFLCQSQDEDSCADSIAAAVLAVSGHHPGYGFPAPITEADSAVKMSEQDMENFYSAILGRVGGHASAMPLRREQRPF
jgi:hypothetical protein